MTDTREDRIRLINEKALFAPAQVTVVSPDDPSDDGQDYIRGFSEDGYVLTERHGRVDPEHAHRAA